MIDDDVNHDDEPMEKVIYAVILCDDFLLADFQCGDRVHYVEIEPVEVKEPVMMMKMKMKIDECFSSSFSSSFPPHLCSSSTISCVVLVPFEVLVNEL